MKDENSGPNLQDLLKTKPPELPDHPSCAFCGSENTEFMALFGQFLLVSQYYCHHCHSAFEWCKWQGEEQSSKCSRVIRV